MHLGLWLLRSLIAARMFLALEPGEPLASAREQIVGREFWVLADPWRPTVPWREARERKAVRYRLLIETGLEAEIPEWVTQVGAVLDDPRGWRAAGREFVRVDAREQFSIVLASPRTIDRLCQPLRTKGVYSCGRNRRASLNAWRWREGAESWGDDVLGYRVYMINHEVGHLLSMQHRRCRKPGQPAAVMLQQTMGLDGCTANGWPTASELESLGRRWGTLPAREPSD